MKGIHLRIEDTIYQDITHMAETRGVTFSQVLRELIDVGLRVKKHMENKKSGQQEEAQMDISHLEMGASSAMEGLLLLRIMAKASNPKWAEEAHAEAAKRLKEIKG